MGLGGGREVESEGEGVVSRSARFSPARWCARYGPAQGGSRGRWASASSVRRPGFKPRTHDWASSVVPGTPRIRQNPPGWYVRGRQIRLSVPLLPLLPFTLFLSFFFPPVAKARQGGPSLYSFRRVRTCLDERPLLVFLLFPLLAIVHARLETCTRARVSTIMFSIATIQTYRFPSIELEWFVVSWRG